MGWAISANTWIRPFMSNGPRLISNLHPHSQQNLDSMAFLPWHLGQWSVILRLGIATKRPRELSTTFKSLTTKALSIVMLQNALSRSVGRPSIFTLASVISMKAVLLILNIDGCPKFLLSSLAASFSASLRQLHSFSIVDPLPESIFHGQIFSGMHN